MAVNRVPGNPVLVVWRDAHAATVTDAWTDPKDIEPGDAIINSVGFDIVLEQKAGHLSLAQSTDDEGHVDNVLCIPLENIVKVIPLVWQHGPLDPTT